MTKQQLSAEFDKKFVNNKREDGEDFTLYMRDDAIKSFFFSQIDKILDEMVPEEKTVYYSERGFHEMNGQNKFRSEILSKIKLFKE